ncbi:hypothetical protein [Collinsella sp. An7]|uniref:hypothetical protein n=1 Tax=Collinsella sp. An7 TaxID=1965651 RepID=UPI001180E4BA|nr:hypothetical protein [Collinsella sp. An7]
MANGRAKTRWLTFALVVSCAIAAAGVLFNCVTSTMRTGYLLTHSTLSWDAGLLRLCGVDLVGVVIDFVLLGAFIMLTAIVLRSKIMFGKTQTKCLACVAVATLMKALVGLALPSIQIPEIAGGFIGPISIAPTLDLRLLSFSFMFFALAGIFEYGRILQEDSDSIL